MYHILSRHASRLEEGLETFLSQDTRLFYWSPVFLGCGIWVYFSLTFEPDWRAALGAALFLGVLAFLTRGRRLLYFLVMPVFLVILGIAAPCVRTHLLATPMLGQELAPQWIEGRLARVEAFPAYQRITLMDPTFQKPFVSAPVTKVRVSLRGRLQISAHLVPGDLLKMKVVLTPSPEPAVPGAHHLRRQAYFEGISAQGYALTPPRLMSDDGPDGPSYRKRIHVAIEDLRTRLNRFFETHLPFPQNAIAKALVTGERSSIPEQVRDAFAASGTAHLLAISGLHLSVVAGLIFVTIRLLLTLITPLALARPIKKWAAALAMVGTCAYWLICGSSLPATRALVMTSLVLGGVLVDRSAITLRNISLAAFLILLFLPEALMSASFVLSFAAALALVSAYDGLRTGGLLPTPTSDSAIARFFTYLLGVSLTTFIATVATTPYLAATFHTLTLEAIPANLVAVPWTTFVLIPLLLLMLLGMPFGTDFGLSHILSWALEVLIKMATTVAGWPGADIPIHTPREGVMVLVTLGGLWLCLVATKKRFFGLAPMALGLGLWIYASPVPDLFVTGDKKVIGVKDTDGRLWVVSKRAGRFARQVWAESCGLAPPEVLDHNKDGLLVDKALHLGGGWRLALEPLILTKDAKVHFQEKDLEALGSTYIWLAGQSPRILGVRLLDKGRPWSCGP